MDVIIAAQDQQPEPVSTDVAGQPGGLEGATDAVWWSVTDAMTISAAVLIFGFLVIALTGWLLRRERESAIVLRALATLLIITFAVFLIVAGYSDQQIAPAMGLLGTIVGYLLGKDVREPPQAEREREREAGG
jgi:NhaP-type Na+/H+ or K+/H+ antiporter